MAELRWAVTDGPDGTAAVALPDDAAASRLLAEQAPGGFWCAREAGGCGGRLAVDADGARPAFVHTGGTRCALVRREGAAERGYEPLRYRRPLVAWLAGQGLDPWVSTLPGRTGLHVALPGAVLEVQLAPVSDLAWRARDDRLHREARSVTWLHGPGAELAAATEAGVRGAALVLRRQNRGLLIGVRDAGGGVRWVRASACRVGPDGVEAPGLAEARAAHGRRAAAREDAARRAARQAARWSSRTGAVPWDVRTGTLPFPAAG
ncbi:hypothetical protein [Geodermatophilus sp. FMUSA9-8]|uniref:hypothetical protein n=1 Tax=Geodermatophilus sp. FMUSA9-8 TaxID=3120155 RepID=UPI00300876EA